jgi:hypothetical protein
VAAVLETEQLTVRLKDTLQAVAYRPHAAQRPIHSSVSRHRVVDAGRRFGKSVIGGHELTHEYRVTAHEQDAWRAAGKRREFWIVGPEYSDAEKEFRVLWNDLKRLEVPLDRPGSYYNAETGDMVISALNGLFMVHARSAKYPTTLVGEGLSGVILAEAAKLKESVWTKFIRPALADFRGWSLHTSTPEGKNWFYESWLRGQDPAQAAWDSWRCPSWLNPIVFPLGREDPEILEMLDEMSEQKFEQEVAAGFTDFVGRVFKAFDEEIHVADLEYDPRYPVYLAMDFGWSNPFVCLAIQVDVFDRVNVLWEYRTTHKDPSEIARDLEQQAICRIAKGIYPDPAEPQDANLIAKTLKVPLKGNTGGELKHRLELIRKALKVNPEHAPEDPDARPQLLINRRCYGLIYEMGEYRYPENKSEIRPDPEQPLDKDDHAPEALGRFFRGYFGLPGAKEGRQRATVRRANMRR